jgi:prepilin-type N-terminal cleavage/methylation domain-containing protein
MQTSAFCPRPGKAAGAQGTTRRRAAPRRVSPLGGQRPAQRRSAGAGFTLIEVLVVLVIVSLLAGVALPRLYLISQRYTIASDRDSLLTDIGNLGYSAYSAGRALELAASADAKDHAVKVPPGWRVEVPKPIRFGFNGICSGGTMVLQAPDGVRESYQLNAPACKPVLAGAAP